MLIGTYRPEDLQTARHPLRQMIQDLVLHKYCHEIELAPLSVIAISEVLAGGTENPPVPSEFIRFVKERTGGIPLFMRVTLDYLLELRGSLSTRLRGWLPLVPLNKLTSEPPPDARTPDRGRNRRDDLTSSDACLRPQARLRRPLRSSNDRGVCGHGRANPSKPFAKASVSQHDPPRGVADSSGQPAGSHLYLQSRNLSAGSLRSDRGSASRTPPSRDRRPTGGALPAGSAERPCNQARAPFRACARLAARSGLSPLDLGVASSRFAVATLDGRFRLCHLWNLPGQSPRTTPEFRRKSNLWSGVLDILTLFNDPLWLKKAGRSLRPAGEHSDFDMQCWALYWRCLSRQYVRISSTAFKILNEVLALWRKASADPIQRDLTRIRVYEERLCADLAGTARMLKNAKKPLAALRKFKRLVYRCVSAHINYANVCQVSARYQEAHDLLYDSYRVLSATSQNPHGN